MSSFDEKADQLQAIIREMGAQIDRLTAEVQASNQRAGVAPRTTLDLFNIIAFIAGSVITTAAILHGLGII